MFYYLYLFRLLLYGRYCSQVETATKHLDKLSNMREDIKMKLEVRILHWTLNFDTDIP